MPESFSLNNLFKKDLTKDQFKADFEEAKNNPEIAENFSIFGDDNIEENLDNIFEAADISGDGIIDETEIAAIKARFQDSNQDTISENDFKILYQEAIIKKFGSGSPAEMYKAAMSSGKDKRESGYVSQLDGSIENYSNLISSCQEISTAKINDLQKRIQDITVKAAIQKGLYTAEYERLAKEARELQTKISAKNIESQKKERELDSAKKEAKRLGDELKELKKDPKTNKVEIEAREFEIGNLNTKIASLTDELTKLNNELIISTTTLKQVQKNEKEQQNKIIKNDRDAAQAIKDIRKQIADEQSTAQEDVANYQKLLQTFQNAREYAVKKISQSQPIANEQMSFNNNADAINQNELSKYGLKYSKEKGEKLARDMRNHAVGFTGYCSRHVSNGLQRTGLGNERMASAHMMDTALDGNKNFKRIQVNSLAELKALPAGCIIVYEANASWNNGLRTGHYNATHGHIEVTLGDGTAASDGITRNMRYADPSQMSVFIPVESA